MSFLLILMLSGLVSASELLDSQCDNECFLHGNVEIQRLAAMMEKNNERSEKRIMELESKLIAMMERNIKDTNDRFERMVKEQNDFLQNQIATMERNINERSEKRIMELESKLIEKNNELESKLQNQTDTMIELLTKITQLKSERQSTNIAESRTSFDCEDIRSLGYDISGVYGVNGGNGQIAHVYCEMSSDGKAWTRILHRQDNLMDFTFKKWAEYEAGFGNPKGSHWMGLGLMNQLTTSREYKMRVDLMDWEGETRFAEYSTFSVGAGSDKYRLSINGYSGTAGDSMTSGHNNMMFTTIDQDNDQDPGNCAHGTDYRTGGWWYGSCFRARLTGTYLQGGPVPQWQGIQWPRWRGFYYSYKVATMKVQRL